MITEDYVSFQTAELLKEKGMDKSCFKHYVQKNNNDGTSEAVTVCTLQIAMKWLRKVHNIHIDIDPDWASKGGFAVIGYCFNIHSIVNPWYEDLVTYPTYEQAVEAAIKYCLENLI